MKALLVICLLVLASLSNAQSCQSASDTSNSEPKCTILNVGLLLANQKQGKGFREIIQQFEAAYPNIRIKISAFKDASYKQNIKKWTLQKSGPDVLYWQGGERLFDLVRKGAIKDITSVWQQYQWDTEFPNQLSNLVTADEDKKFGLPFAYYQWGFYYKKSIFEELGITPPKTWNEFLEIGRVFKQKGKDFIAIGTQEKWPTAAWFDYLNLRINGYDYHRQLLNGEIDFKDSRLKGVFTLWQEMINEGLFVNRHDKLSWREAVPLIYREQAGVTLIGNFLESSIPNALKNDIGFFPFPQIDQTVPRVELIPTEIWAISQWTDNASEATLFLNFLARPDIQHKLALALGYIPANLNNQLELSPLSEEGKQLLLTADNTFQYLDRDANQDFAEQAINIFSEFMLNAQIESAQRKLNAHRHLLQYPNTQ